MATKKKASKKKAPRSAAEGASWVRVEDRGEIKLRCRGCSTVVPVQAWWDHVCPPKKEQP